MSEKKVTCACPSEHADAVQCVDLRYFGYSPGPNSEKPDWERDECPCVCHEKDEDVLDDDDWRQP